MRTHSGNLSSISFANCLTHPWLTIEIRDHHGPSFSIFGDVRIDRDSSLQAEAPDDRLEDKDLRCSSTDLEKGSPADGCKLDSCLLFVLSDVYELHFSDDTRSKVLIILGIIAIHTIVHMILPGIGQV